MKASVLFIAILALALLIIPMISLNLETAIPDDTPAEVHSPAVPQVSSPEEEPSASPLDDVVDPDEPDEDTLLETIYADEEDEEDAGEEDVEGQTVPAPAAEGVAGVAGFNILDEATGEVNYVPVRDYVRGAVAAEMPANFHSEALKAQAVAAHTYALRNHYNQQESPDPALQGADFSADPSNRLGYVTEADARDFFGDKADQYWDKICQAADEVLHYIMVYEGEPIVAAYHAMSAGNTEDASNVWSGGAPYLVPVESEGDLLAPDYETSFTLPSKEVAAILETAYAEIELGEDPQSWFGKEVRSPSGYLTGVEVGGITLHGKDLRTVFDLRSHNMDISYSDAGFTFTTYGYGHGVGLSQYGADFLARQDYAFEDILTTYYTGVSIVRIGIEEEE